MNNEIHSKVVSINTCVMTDFTEPVAFPLSPASTHKGQHGIESTRPDN